MFAAPQLYVASWLVEDRQFAAIYAADWVVWAVVAYLGIIMTAVGYAIWYHLLGKYPVHQVAPFLLLLPVTTVLGGVLLLDEPLTLRLTIGGLIAIGGVALINLIRRKPEAEAT
ncbi:MAG: putative amino-acid metabolite efflux pump [Gammaproteobacteria bacterium]|nr:putative amino-acid metabolite efflux pump [Gammaproteobacteria bacterium]